MRLNMNNHNDSYLWMISETSHLREKKLDYLRELQIV